MKKDAKKVKRVRKTGVKSKTKAVKDKKPPIGKIRIVKKAPKKVEGQWGGANKYICEGDNKKVTYTAVKMLADGKKRVDTVTLDAKKISHLKRELKKGEKGSFDKLVIELVTKPCFLDSQARKQGLTKNTAYCPVNQDMREILS